LPLLLWGIERARKPQGGPPSVVAIGIAIAWSILAGFPEIAYINGLLALTWATYRFATEPRRWWFAWRVFGGGVLGLMLAAPLLVAFVHYMLLSDAFSTHGLGENSLPWSAFSVFVVPYIYGLPFTSIG